VNAMHECEQCCARKCVRADQCWVRNVLCVSREVRARSGRAHMKDTIDNSSAFIIQSSNSRHLDGRPGIGVYHDAIELVVPMVPHAHSEGTL
jgi:hypothetical protein